MEGFVVLRGTVFLAPVTLLVVFGCLQTVVFKGLDRTGERREVLLAT